jgi:thioredoxin-like negative regulator of GroEL
MLKTLVLVFVLLVLLVQLSDCKRLGGNELNAEEFETEVTGSKFVYLVEFFSSMCGSCKEFSPVWDTVEESLAKKLKTGKINIDKKAGLAIAQEMGIMEDGIPSLVLFTSKGAIPLKLGA